MTATETVPAAAAASPFDFLPVAQVHESKTNPRRTFDKAKLQELTDSVRQFGVLQPILVRVADDGWELVAGARRLRAAKAAGLETIPATVQELSDRQVLEIQITENLQRDDLHPLEEAEGYRTLHERHGYDVEQLAAKVGKSKAYVYARMKLCELAKKAAQFFRDGKLDASTALLVARIPVPELQEKAAAELVHRQPWQGPITFREAKQHVEHHYMLRLKEAPFDRSDAALVPAAGACGPCPKRTGNQRDLFGDVAGGADVCTDPKCFRAKVDAQWARVRAEAESKGQTVLEGKAAERAGYSGNYVALEDTCYQDSKQRKWKQVLRGGDAPTVLRRGRDGEIETLVARKDAIAAARKLGLRLGSDNGSLGRSAQDKKRDAARRLRLAAVQAALPDVVAAAEKAAEADVLRYAMAHLVSRGHSEGVKQLEKRRGTKIRFAWNRSKATRDALAKLDANTLRGMLVELIAADQPAPNWHTRGYSDDWTEACRIAGIRMAAYERAAAPKKKPKAPAKPKAAKPARRKK